MEPDALVNPFDKSPILIGKNVGFSDFTLQAPSFHIEEFFEHMGWISIATLEECAYPPLIKEFYKTMVVNPHSGDISCLLNNKRIVITKALIRHILELKPCETQIFLYKAHPTLEGYNPTEACCRVTGKDFENITKISANQLTLLCKVLQNIIANVILPRKGHRNEVSSFDLFILDSFLVHRKLDFPTIALGLMKLVHSSRYVKALPFDMFLTKIFKHCNVAFNGKTSIKLRSIDTINTQTLRCMKITKKTRSMGCTHQRV